MFVCLLLFLLGIESLELPLRVPSWCNRKNKGAISPSLPHKPLERTLSPAPLPLNPHCSAAGSSPPTTMATSGLQRFPIRAKAGGWGEMAQLLPNPGKAVFTFHGRSERRLARALLENRRKTPSLCHARTCHCLSHRVLLLYSPGSGGSSRGRCPCY